MLMLQMRHSSDVCDLTSTLCKYDLREGDLFCLVGKYLIRAANVWWRSAQYFLITSHG